MSSGPGTMLELRDALLNETQSYLLRNRYKEELCYGVTNAVIRTSRGCTEDTSGGLTEEALSQQGPRDLGKGSRLGKLGRGPAGDACRSTELESERMGVQGMQGCHTTGRRKDEQIVTSKAFSAL